MPLILYPDVPQVPGVPTVLRQIGAAVAEGLAIANTELVFDLVAVPQWGLFDSDGQPALQADAVVSVEERQEQRLPTYQIEEGGFGTYNKVAQPYEAKVSYAQGGTIDSRQTFMGAVRALVESLDVYTLITPEYSVEGVNVIHYDTSRRARNGAALLQVDLWVQEVRIVPTAQFTKTADPSGAATQDNGRVSTSAGTIQNTTTPATVTQATPTPTAPAVTTGQPVAAGGTSASGRRGGSLGPTLETGTSIPAGFA